MNFFSIGLDDEFTFHETAEEAREYAEGHLEHATDDGYSDGIECICWGEIRERAIESNVRTVEELEASEDPDDQDLAQTLRRGGWDYTSDWDLVPVSDEVKK